MCGVAGSPLKFHSLMGSAVTFSNTARVASGVVMAMVKSGARVHLRREFDVARLASELNDVLCTLLEPNMFATAAIGATSTASARC